MNSADGNVKASVVYNLHWGIFHIACSAILIVSCKPGYFLHTITDDSYVSKATVHILKLFGQFSVTRSPLMAFRWKRVTFVRNRSVTFIYGCFCPLFLCVRSHISFSTARVGINQRVPIWSRYERKFLGYTTLQVYFTTQSLICLTRFTCHSLLKIVLQPYRIISEAHMHLYFTLMYEN